MTDDEKKLKEKEIEAKIDAMFYKGLLVATPVAALGASMCIALTDPKENNNSDEDSTKIENVAVENETNTDETALKYEDEAKKYQDKLQEDEKSLWTAEMTDIETFSDLKKLAPENNPISMNKTVEVRRKVPTRVMREYFTKSDEYIKTRDDIYYDITYKFNPGFCAKFDRGDNNSLSDSRYFTLGRGSQVYINAKEAKDLSVLQFIHPDKRDSIEAKCVTYNDNANISGKLMLMDGDKTVIMFNNINAEINIIEPSYLSEKYSGILDPLNKIVDGLGAPLYSRYESMAHSDWWKLHFSDYIHNKPSFYLDKEGHIYKFGNHKIAINFAEQTVTDLYGNKILVNDDFSLKDQIIKITNSEKKLLAKAIVKDGAVKQIVDFDENSNIVKESFYKNNKADGVQYEYNIPMAMIKQATTMKEGKKQGLSITIDCKNNSTKKDSEAETKPITNYEVPGYPNLNDLFAADNFSIVVENYEQDVLNGQKITMKKDENGLVTVVSNYQDGKLDGVQEEYKNNNLFQRKTYKAGELEDVESMMNVEAKKLDSHSMIINSLKKQR